MIKFNEWTLNNGIQVVVAPLPGLKSVTVEVFLKVGSKYESADFFGMSHFLEHMAFKGTEKRKTAFDLSKEMDGRGAVHNAGTGHEWTSYYIKTVATHVPWAIEILADILVNPTFPEAEVLKERGVVMEEIRMYDDNPTMGLAYTFMEKFLKGEVGCWSIAGKVKDIEKITRNKVVDYRNSYFDTNNIVVVIAGDALIDSQLDVIKGDIEKVWGGLRTKKVELPKVKIGFGEGQETIKKDIEQAHYCLAWPGVSWVDKRRYAAKLLEVMLAGNSSSRLWRAIREDRGLAYYLFPMSEHFEDMGFMGVQVGVAANRLEEAIEVTKTELLGFGGSVDEIELERAKDSLLGKLQLSMDETDFWTDFIGQRKLIYGDLMSVEQAIEKYRGVKLEDIKAVAGEVLGKNSFRQLVMKR